MLCKFILWMVVATISSEFVSAATDKIVCYHGTWSKYRQGNGRFGVGDIDPSLCTHLIYSFVGLSKNDDGSVVSLDSHLDVTLGNLANFNALKIANPNLKILLAIGGWNEGSVKYSTVAASATLRQNFIQSALKWVQTYGFDGFDLDWEFPGQRGGSVSDIKNFADLCKEFREVFDKHNLLLSAAVAATTASIAISYDVPSVSKYLDFINVMAYDLHASWDGFTGHNAPLYASHLDNTASEKNLNIDSVVRGWITNGADPQKLVLGLPFYGRSFTLSSASNVALGATASGAGLSGPYTLEPGMLGYNEIVEKQVAGGWTIVWDDVQKVPHMYKGDQWVCYDDPKSITLKVEYAKSANLSGVMVWTIETDDFRGISGTKFALLTAINEVLKTSSSSSNGDSTSNNNGDSSSNSNNDSSNNSNNDSSNNSNNDSSNNSNKDTSNDSSSDNGSINNSSGGSSDVKNDDENANDGNSDSASSGTTNHCTSEGFVRDPTDCSTFYFCHLHGGNYIATSSKCPSGLYFDIVSNVCNWKFLVTGC